MKMLVIAGPTASGKSELAIKLAKKLNGEIIAADSRTVYKGMDIGTAKPTPQQRRAVKHYCLDIAEPDHKVTVADFIEHAKKDIEQIRTKGKLPIIVGGSGLFIDSLVYDYSFTKPNQDLRNKYEPMNIEQLQQEIIKQGLTMPLNKRNKRHLVATLERQGYIGSKKGLPKGTKYICINPPKHELITRIEARADIMFNAGAIEEATKLYDKYGRGLNAFNGGIYKLIPQYLDGRLTLSDLKSEFINSDKKLAKKQLTWFRRNNDIVWFEDLVKAYDWLVSE